MNTQPSPASTVLMPCNDVANAPEVAGWREVDAMLARIALARGALDAEEAPWLLAAERTQVHRHRGCVTLLEYFERVLAHSPRAARDRLRVAEALRELPGIRGALANGCLPFSSVRELTRVAVPETETA